ncbi:MAG: DNA topoisomerase (ATP-hydrolyzing) subunit B [Clostridia bacterium]|nr:DNA topoisomerase (ATP-hydrolyzing) subunit B [Clostridia bacterium]MBO5913170.1 DNA topoisomerase (ATP-hydrolyzing) subunit B [Clostridia bacterium]
MSNDIKTPVTDNYDESSIQVLEGLEAVRKRPGMYIGSTGERGLHHLVYEIVDNSIDEALAGYCDTITVDILDDGIIRVTDNGRGIPVGINPQKGIPTVTVVFTILHAGGKFGGSGYKVSGGLHGVGASVVNALSTWLEVEVKDGKNIHHQRYEKGNIATELKIIGETNETGTTVTFKPDPTIFTDTTTYDYEILEKRLREQAFLNAGVKIVLTDKRTGGFPQRTDEFHYEGGIKSYVEFLLEGTKGESLNKEVIYFNTEVNDQTAEIAMVWSTKDSKIMSFANTLYTVDGGTHEQGFKQSVANTVNKFAFDFKHLKEGNKRLKGDDICEGLVAVVSVKLSDAQFESQTKAKLGNTSIGKVVREMVNEKLYRFLEENPQEAKKIIDKIIAYSNAREAAQAALEASLKKAGIGGGKTRMPEKLTDCISTDATKTEIYIVEGDSAGGSAVEGRNSTYQAILPLWGKMLNVEKARDDKVYGNDKLTPVIIALGTGIGDNFNIEKLRYDKIVIMADADVDGSHIRTLLLTFFFRYMPELIETGHIYLAQPPLYRISKGKQHFDAFTDEEKAMYIDQLGGQADVQRYKGLGEMDPDQLWETTLDPERRTMLRVTMADAEIADRTFSILMGDEVEPRRQFIEENAQFATDLDI